MSKDFTQPLLQLLLHARVSIIMNKL